MMSAIELERYDNHRKNEVKRWRAEQQAQGLLAECPLDTDGFWHRDNCINRRAILTKAAGTKTHEQRLVAEKLKRCTACWNSFACGH